MLNPSDQFVVVSESGGDTSISGFTGNFTDGSEIIVSGAGLGSPPHGQKFENCSGFTAVGQNMDDVPNNFDYINQYYVGTSVADSRSGTYSVDMSAAKNETEYTNAVNEFQHLDDPSTEFFVVGSFKNPIGKYMPGAAAPNTYSGPSNWKAIWVRSSSNVNDICCPTNIGDDRWSISGNDITNLISNFGDQPDDAPPLFWRFGEWSRFCTWVKAPDDLTSATGKVHVQVTNENAGFFSYENNSAHIFGDGQGQEPYQFRRAAFAGYFGTNTQPETQILYDDMYYAWGDNSASRFEVGTEAVYSNNGKLSICDCVIDDCDNTSWKINVRQSDIDFTGDVYLYKINELNELAATYKVL